MDPNTFTVDGQKVTVKATIALKAAPRLPDQITRFAESKNGDDIVRFLTNVLESWDFDGAPTNPSAYQDLDLYEEILPIGEKAVRILNARLELGRQQITTGDEPNEFFVDGRLFRVRKRIPLSLAPRLPEMMSKYGLSGDAGDLVKLFTTVAEASDLVDPVAEARAYQNLDLFGVVLPLGERVIAYLNQKLEYARSKN